MAPRFRGCCADPMPGLSQANAMEAQGDKMGAETIRHEIDQLLSSSKVPGFLAFQRISVSCVPVLVSSIFEF